MIGLWQAASRDQRERARCSLIEAAYTVGCGKAKARHLRKAKARHLPRCRAFAVLWAVSVEKSSEKTLDNLVLILDCLSQELVELPEK